MKYRLANFCDKVCKESWEGFVRVFENPASEDFIKVWEGIRRANKCCFYCSQKLPKSRTRSIG